MPIESFVLFVDILGFADLVMESGELGVLTLSPSVRPTANERLASDIALRQSSALQRRFSFFHQCIDEYLPRINQGLSGGASLVFSDCAFLQKHDAEEAVQIAIEMMRQLIGYHVPVRMGFAKGELRVLRFQSDSYGWNINHSTQFLGPGVVRATRAEKCGAKGMRILVDPSIEGDLMAAGARLIDVNIEKPSWPVTKEVNYLWSESEYAGSQYDVMRGAFPTLDAYEDFMLTRRIADMRSESKPDKQHIYDETAEALAKMRTQLGRRIGELS